MNCEACQILITDAVFDNGELPDHFAIKTHLEQCAECTAFLSELKGNVASLRLEGLSGPSYEDIPQRANLDSLWNNIQPSLDKIDAERFRQRSKKSYRGPLASLVAIAACLAIFIGIQQEPVEAPASSPGVAQSSINPELINYLNRAQVMLLQVANSSAPQAMDIPMSQNFARDMALEASFLNSDGNYSVNAGQKKLLKDIEFLLTQIANLDESNAALGVDLLQRFLEEKNILFKIRLLELREKQNLI
jgi:hypothetical protein